MTVAVVIQARMGSTRLPGKSLTRLGEVTTLDWIATRAGLARQVDEVFVATSTESEDDVIAEHCAQAGIACVRGSALDVLDRFRVALDHTDADLIVRLTADCPFVDPTLIDLTISTCREAVEADYASTSLDGRFPRGLDVEAVRRAALEAAADEALDALEREHVTLFVYRRAERFGCVPVVAPEWARRPDLRFTVDEPDDLQVCREVVRISGKTPTTLEGRDVVSILTRHPEVAALNADVLHRNVT